MTETFKPMPDRDSVLEELSEYETPRSPTRQVEWVNEKMEEICETYGEAEFRKRSHPMVKKLIEEALPISRWSIQWQKVGLEVTVTCHAGNQPFDAMVSATGYKSFSYPIEVVSTSDYQDALRREKLSTCGSVAAYGPISRLADKSISDQMACYNFDTRVIEQAEAAISRIQDKCAKPYDPSTVLLVCVDTGSWLSLRSRALLLNRICKGGPFPPTFQHIEVMNMHDYGHEPFSRRSSNGDMMVYTDCE